MKERYKPMKVYIDELNRWNAYVNVCMYVCTYAQMHVWYGMVCRYDMVCMYE